MARTLKTAEDAEPRIEMTAEVFARHLGDLSEAKQKLDDASSYYRSVRKIVKGAGINLAAVDIMLKESRQDPGKTKLFYTDLAKYKAWRGLPIGFQAELFAGEKAGAAEADTDEERGAESIGAAAAPVKTRRPRGAKSVTATAPGGNGKAAGGQAKAKGNGHAPVGAGPAAADHLPYGAQAAKYPAEREEGRAAGAAGKNIFGNPYKVGSGKWQAWERGWHEGQLTIMGDAINGGQPIDSAGAPAGEPAVTLQ